jgi:dipeptidyl aminopeptidase/acylaminoacyl peptidase
LTFDTAADEYPAWSPDGLKIAFRSYRDGNYEIYVMNADGTGQPTRLTFGTAYDEFPSWSPDGSKIAFMSDRDGNFEIYVMNADGNEQTCLTLSAAADGLPYWSPDGLKIAFASERDGNWEIYVMNADGTGQTRLTMNPAGDYDTSWGSAVKPGSLEVTSSPPQAKIIVDGIDTEQVTRWKFNDMAPGDYKVYVTLEGYSIPATETVKVISGQTASLHFKLDKVKKVK